MSGLPISAANGPAWMAPRLEDIQGAGSGDFSQMLQQAIAQANHLEQEAQKLDARLALGEPVDLHDVVIAAEKARLALDLVVQVRNKAIEAYQEIMRMQM